VVQKPGSTIVGRRILAARIASGLTSVELAKLAVMDQGQYSRTERGEHLPSLFTAARIAIGAGRTVVGTDRRRHSRGGGGWGEVRLDRNLLRFEVEREG
jgi:transcriptional regulator with XRE-family HTH domain